MANIASSRNMSRKESTYRDPLGRYSPVSISEDSRWRFHRHRYAECVRRIGGGTPDDRQALAIAELVASQWDEEVANHDIRNAKSDWVREAAYRRKADAAKRVLLWDRALTAATPKPASATPPQPNLSDVLADIASRAQSGNAEPEDTEDAA